MKGWTPYPYQWQIILLKLSSMSGIFKLGWKDLLKGLIVVCLAAVFAALLKVLPTLPFLQDPVVQAFVSAFLGYLSKNLMTDENGKLIGKL